MAIKREDAERELKALIQQALDCVAYVKLDHVDHVITLFENVVNTLELNSGPTARLAADDDALLQSAGINNNISVSGVDLSSEEARILQHTPKQTALVRLAVADSSRSRDPSLLNGPLLPSSSSSSGSSSAQLSSSLSSSSSSSTSSLSSLPANGSSGQSPISTHVNSFVKPLQIAPATKSITQDYASPSIQRRSIVGASRAGPSNHAAAAAAATASHAASARATGGAPATSGGISGGSLVGSSGGGESSDEGASAGAAPLRLKPRPKDGSSGAGAAAGISVGGQGGLMNISDPLAQPRALGPLGLSRGSTINTNTSTSSSSPANGIGLGTSQTASSGGDNNDSITGGRPGSAGSIGSERFVKTHATQDYSSPRVTARSMRASSDSGGAGGVGAGGSSRARAAAAASSSSGVSGSVFGDSISNGSSLINAGGAGAVDLAGHDFDMAYNSASSTSSAASSSASSSIGSSSALSASVNLLESEGGSGSASDPENSRPSSSFGRFGNGNGNGNGLASGSGLGLSAARGSASGGAGASALNSADFVARSPAQVNTQSKLLQLAHGQGSENLLGTPKPTFLKRLDSPDVRGGQLIAKRKQLTQLLQHALTFVSVVDLNAFTLVKSQLQEALEALEAGCVDPNRVDTGILGAGSNVDGDIVK